MSGWIQNFAEKAETMLVKLDQNAKNVLVTSTEENQKLMPSSTQPDLRIENEVVSKPIKSTRPVTKPSTLQLTPKKTASYSSNLSSLGGSKDTNLSAKETGKNSTTSSRRSSITQDGSVIENFTEASMQTSIEVKTESAAQVRLVEMEEICNSLVTEKEYLVERNQILEEANDKNIKIISDLEATISRHHRNELELNEKLDWAKKETDQAIVELQQYRTRAQQTLQMKENLIKQLKEGKQVDGEAATDITALQIEVQQLQIDKKHLQDEIHNFNVKWEQIKIHTAKLEQRLEESYNREQKLRELQDSLKEASFKCGQLEEELKAKVDEVVTIREESTKQRAGLLTKVSEREGEIQSLRAKLTQRQQNMLTSDAEERIHSLTHSLVQKQAALESITAERNALRIQLEKLDVSILMFP